MISGYIFFAFAGISSLAMGLFFLMDMYFESRGVYKRPSQVMIISSLVPILTVPTFILTPWWQIPSLFIWFWAFVAGAFLIWGNWFYFWVMFPVDKSNREAEAVEGATELALYEGTTPAIVLILSLVASQFLVYSDSVSALQGFAIIIAVLGLVLFATADGYTAFKRWSYRIKLIVFALLVSFSQLIQDLIVNHLQSDFGYTLVEAYFTVSPIVWIGMFSGIIIVFWKQEWKFFVAQWHDKIYKYAWFILFAEIIAVVSYAALIASYTGEHVAVSGAIAASFPVLVFFGGLLLQKLNIQTGIETVTTSNILKKFFFIIITLLGVAGVIFF